MCVIGVAIFLANFNPGISIVIKMMQVVFLFKDADTDYLDDLRIWYAVLATVTLTVGALVVLTDYLHAESRFNRNPMCQFCAGVAPCVLVKPTCG